MKKQERIEALEIALKYKIEAIKSWWDPFQNVQWNVLKSKNQLSYEQYYYLTNNGFLTVIREPKKGEKAILSISEKGKFKLKSLQGLISI